MIVIALRPWLWHSNHTRAHAVHLAHDRIVKLSHALVRSWGYVLLAGLLGTVTMLPVIAWKNATVCPASP